MCSTTRPITPTVGSLVGDTLGRDVVGEVDGLDVAGARDGAMMGDTLGVDVDGERDGLGVVGALDGVVEGLEVVGAVEGEREGLDVCFWPHAHRRERAEPQPLEPNANQLMVDVMSPVAP